MVRGAMLAVCVAGLLSLAVPDVPARTISPVGAGVISAVVPGSGQIYAGYEGTGLGFLGLEAVIAVAAVGESVELLVGMEADGAAEGWIVAFCGVHIWNVVDAVHRANRHNQAERAKGKALLPETPSSGWDVKVAPVLRSGERGLSASVEFRF